MTRLRHIGFAAVVAAALTAGPAAAKDICVGAGAGCYGSIQQAIDVAAANAGHDRVLIGPGVWTTNNTANDDVTIEGAGDGTILTQTIYGTGAGLPFVLAVSGAGAEVRNLHIALPSGAQPRGLYLTSGAKADHVTIDGGGATFGVGVTAVGGSRFSGDVDLPSTNTGAILLAGSGVTDARIAGAPAMRVMAGAGGALVRRSTIAGHGTLLSAESGALTVEDTLLDARSGYPGAALSTYTDQAPALHRVDLRNVTVLGHGDDKSSPGIDARSWSAGEAVTVTLRDSVVSNFGSHALQRGGSGTANLNIDHVDVHPQSIPYEFGPGSITTAEMTNADPGFAADGFTPAAGSPLIDVGTPGALGPDESTTDLLGNPRLVASGCGEARRDLGAVEAPGSCTPPAPQPGVQPGPPATDATAPRVTHVRVVHRRSVRFTVSEAARVTIRIARAHSRAIIVKRTVGAGRVVLKLKHALRHGRYRVRVVAVDAAGNRSAPAIVRRKV